MLLVLLVVRMSVRRITKKVMNGFRIRIYDRITLIWEVYKLRVPITDQSIKFRDALDYDLLLVGLLPSINLFGKKWAGALG